MTKPIPELTPKQQARFWAKVDVRGPDECWPWIGAKNEKGYGIYSVTRRRLYAHRLALSLSGKDLRELQACHSCDNRLCCNAAHLWLGTQSDNHADMVAKGRHARGVRHASRTCPERTARGESVAGCKLTPFAIRNIRDDGRRQRIIAADYGVARSLISLIKSRKIWRHVA